MTSLTPSEACGSLAKALSDVPRSLLNSYSRSMYDIAVSGLGHASQYPPSGKDGIKRAMRALACRLDQSSQPDDLWATHAMEILATTTREVPFWRATFGLSSKPTNEDNKTQISGDAGPDCVLELARRIVSRPWREETRNQIRSALRLIANCCADNNVNRAIIIRRGGIAAMMKLARTGRECDLLLPTLYNVCTEYDEPAVDDDGKPWALPDQLHSPNAESTAASGVNLAEQKLAMSLERSTGLTSIEVLLDTKDYRGEECLPVLADLVEMASRSAIYGIQHILGNESDDAINLDTGSLSLIDSLLKQGTDIVIQDPDCSPSISQAVLNLLTQGECRKALLDVDCGIWLLIHLFYLTEQDDPEDRAGAHHNRAGLLRMVYEISALPEYAVKHGPESALIRSCVEKLRLYQERPRRSAGNGGPTNSHHPFAPICVLLSNMVTSRDRAESLLKSTDITDSLFSLLQCEDDTDVLLPALNLATKLALNPEGQKRLHDVGLLKFLPLLLVRTNLTLDIQRETLALIRLIVKSQPDYLDDLKAESLLDAGRSEKGGLWAVAMPLFRRTIDAGTKLELGRLVIEISRTLLGFVQKEPTTPEHVDEECGALFGSEIRDVADPVIFVIKEGQSEGVVSEGWFGLATMSMWPSGRRFVLEALDKNGMREILINVVASKRGPSYENLKWLVVKLQSVPSNDIPPNLKDVLENAASEMGVDWVLV